MTNQQENSKNPFLELNTKFRPYSVQSLSISQARKLLSVITTYEDFILFQLAINCGLRREDIVALETKNIDLDNNTLTFYENKKRRMHTVPYNDEVKQSLIRYLKLNRTRWLFPSSHSGVEHISGYMPSYR